MNEWMKKQGKVHTLCKQDNPLHFPVSATVSYRQVVADTKSFKMFDETTLEVTATTGLYSRVHQTLYHTHTHMVHKHIEQNILLSITTTTTSTNN